MLNKLKQLESETLAKIVTLSSEDALVAYRNEVTGKNGSLTEILKGIKDLSIEEKQTVGKVSNDLKNTILAAFDAQIDIVRKAAIAAKLATEFVDMTMPVTEDRSTHLHPITRVLRLVEDTFVRMGFDICESKEIATEYANFDAVNIPANHPARDMQDTFWLTGSKHVLATHTSSMQNHIMKTHSLPIRTIIPGRVFRNEALDARHENTFYQVEGIVIDKNINVSHMKYTLKTMLSDVFGRPVDIRMRPGYFPFVEPGVEVDCSCPFCQHDGKNCKVCHGSGWIEVVPAGLIHPNVLREGGIDPEVYSGFAF
jgi:phenylalanyl-tRNA synthetase alpha chain